MKGKVKEIFENILGTFYNNKDGYSARKVTAFTIISCVVAIHFVWLKRAMMTDNFMYLESILIADYAFVSALLGMTTYQAVKKENIKKEEDAKV